MLLDQPQPVRAHEREEVNLLPPPELSISLFRSLFGNLRDLIVPKRLPPLQLTSRPLHVGMLVGDILDLPWYRTIVSSIGDLISPETLPPLQLESEPVDVELISDQPAWWRSLLRNLADTLAPERQAALRLTSWPVNPEMASQVLTTPRWSALIDPPKVFAGDFELLRSKSASSDRPTSIAVPIRTILVQLPHLDTPPADEYERRLVLHLQRSVRRSHMRELVWLGVIAAQVTALVVVRLIPH
jgi:hypothetical protein